MFLKNKKIMLFLDCFQFLTLSNEIIRWIRLDFWKQHIYYIVLCSKLTPTWKQQSFIFSQFLWVRTACATQLSSARSNSLIKFPSSHWLRLWFHRKAHLREEKNYKFIQVVLGKIQICRLLDGGVISLLDVGWRPLYVLYHMNISTRQFTTW